MTSDTLFINENKINRHFDLVNSGDDDDDDEQPILVLSPTTKSIDDEKVTLNNQIKTFDDKKLNKLYNNWLELDAELCSFETKHKIYVTKLDEVESLKTEYRNEFDKYKKKVSYLQKDLEELQKTYVKKG